MSKRYLTTTPEPKEEPRVRGWEDCPSPVMCVHLHSLKSINVCTNSEVKQLFWVCLFFVFSFARQTNGLMDGRMGGLRMDEEVATDDISHHFPGARRRASTEDLTVGSAAWSNGRWGGGVPTGWNPAPSPLPVHVPVMSWRRDLSYQ